EPTVRTVAGHGPDGRGEFPEVETPLGVGFGRSARLAVLLSLEPASEDRLAYLLRAGPRRARCRPWDLLFELIEAECFGTADEPAEHTSLDLLEVGRVRVAELLTSQCFQHGGQL